MPENIIADFEEAFRVIKLNHDTYVGAHPLQLPMSLARGVYGGHTVAQTLLVAIESAGPGYIPHSFHSFFIAAGSALVPMEFKVITMSDDGEVIRRFIKVMQKGAIRFTALVSLIRSKKSRNEEKKEKPSDNETQLTFQRQPNSLHYKYPDVSKVNYLKHTGYIRNAYSEEFIDHKKVPAEMDQSPADRWIEVWSGMCQPQDKFKNSLFNYVGIGDLSDSVFLTTLARILHASWNPTESRSFEEVDLDKDARQWMNISLNALHIFHYNAMSLDHHIYFHTDDAEDFDVCKDWLTFNYQARRISNSRTLVRGYMFNKDGKHVATVAQEGLTIGFKGFDTIPEESKERGVKL